MENSQTAQKKSFHYGWCIVFSCLMIMCFGMCVVMNCTGLFIKPVSEGLGITRQAFSLNSTMVSMAMMGVAFFAGRIFSKFSVKRVMMLASVGISLSYMCFSIAPTIYVFYGISMLVGFFLALLAQVPSSLLITRWFNEKRGLAMGLVFMGSGLGGLILNPIIGQLITNLGWRTTYFILGLLMLITIAPCTFFIIRSDPADMGLEPYGGKIVVPEGVVVNDGVFLKEAKQDKRFWIWLSVAAMTTASCSAIVQQLTSYVSDIGYSYTMAANISAISLGILALGKVILGQLFDKVGVPRTSFLSVVLILLACICLTMAQSMVMLVGFLLLFGLGCAFTTVAYPIITTELFGKKDYSSIYGIVSVAGSIGTAVGSPVAAGIFDATGSYVYAWYVAAIFCAINIFSFTIIFKKKKQA